MKSNTVITAKMVNSGGVLLLENAYFESNLIHKWTVNLYKWKWCECLLQISDFLDQRYVISATVWPSRCNTFGFWYTPHVFRLYAVMHTQQCCRYDRTQQLIRSCRCCATTCTLIYRLTGIRYRIKSLPIFSTDVQIIHIVNILTLS